MISLFKKKSFLLLSIALLVAFFFRFYNYQNFQYWSGDEEMASAVIRKIVVERKPVLISPNTTISASLGSLFHLSTAPLFGIFNMNPAYVLLMMGLLGLITTFILYFLGKSVKNEWLGFTLSILYGGSFLMGLFDRRWWPLTLNALLSALALLALYKIIIEKKYWYSIFLAVSIGFAGHSEPSLAVGLFATVISFIVFRINPFRKAFLAGLITLIIFAAPLLFFEARHPGTIIYPVIKSLTGGIHDSASPSDFHTETNKYDLYLGTFSRLFLTPYSDYADKQFCYCSDYGQPIFGSFTKVVILLLLLYPLFILIKTKEKKEKDVLKLAYIYLLSFLIASFVFNSVSKNPIHQHYFLVSFPIIIFLVGYSLFSLVKSKIMLCLILIIYVITNGYSLLNSQFRYPLPQLTELVSNTVNHLPDNNFSLYAVNYEGLGWTSLFILNNKHPQKSYLYPFIDWMYRAQSLYTVNPTNQEQKKVVVIGPANIPYPFPKDKIIYKSQVGKMQSVILDNSDYWFDSKIIGDIESQYKLED
jgi:4-amino-4-deoxy-L-arabinose transferase-like glycosyltransferase